MTIPELKEKQSKVKRNIMLETDNKSFVKIDKILEKERKKFNEK